MLKFITMVLKYINDILNRNRSYNSGRTQLGIYLILYIHIFYFEGSKY